jgi:hypothetical protein
LQPPKESTQHSQSFKPRRNVVSDYEPEELATRLNARSKEQQQSLLAVGQFGEGFVQVFRFAR